MLFQKISLTATAAILSLLTDSALAHMKIGTPVPFNNLNLDNGPLISDGSDFPCKVPVGSKYIQPSTGRNVMAIGSTQKLTFIGSAVHGGGSCQLSLSTDLAPTKSSKWMVIKSIEGGCPANVAGNLPSDPNGNGAAAFDYQIPADIAPGDYTFAWTWVNKIGNREFYMNCAPITVTAAKKKRYAPSLKVDSELDKRANFPEMFVANLKGVNDCTTPETFDYKYPNPGSNVQLGGAGPFTQLACGAKNNVPAETPSSASTPKQTSASSSGSGAKITSSKTNSGSSSKTAQPGVFASGAAAQSPASPAQASVTSTAVVSPVPKATSNPSPNSSPSGGSSSGGSSSGSTGATSHTAGTACSDEGLWSCAADGSSFQRCASGRWSTSMQMATGMHCTPGDSSTLNMVAGKMKRHAESHVQRHSNRVRDLFRRSSH